MKIYSKILAVVALIMLVAAPLHAQKKPAPKGKAKAKTSKLYVGGSVGLSFTNLNDGMGNGEQSNQSGLSYRLLPEVGYNINKNLSVGLSAGFTKGFAAFGSTNPGDLKGIVFATASALMDVASDVDFAVAPMRILGFRFAPYARFTLISGKMVDIFVDGVMGYTGISIQTYGTDANGNQTWSANGNQYTVMELAAHPGFKVKLSDQFSIMGHLGAAGLSSLKRKDSEMGMTRFGLDLDTSNILLGFVVNL